MHMCFNEAWVHNVVDKSIIDLISDAVRPAESFDVDEIADCDDNAVSYSYTFSPGHLFVHGNDFFGTEYSYLFFTGIIFGKIGSYLKICGHIHKITSLFNIFNLVGKAVLNLLI